MHEPCTRITAPISDTEDPTITCPVDQTVPTDDGQNYSTKVLTSPVVSDNSGKGPSVICHPSKGSSLTLGITSVTCDAFDDAENTASCHFEVQVVGKLLLFQNRR